MKGSLESQQLLPLQVFTCNVIPTVVLLNPISIWRKLPHFTSHNKIALIFKSKLIRRSMFFFSQLRHTLLSVISKSILTRLLLSVACRFQKSVFIIKLISERFLMTISSVYEDVIQNQNDYAKNAHFALL